MAGALRSAASLIVIGLLLTACSVAAGGGPRFTLSRFGDGIADPLAIEISGLQPGENVTLTATARTVSGVWRSRAVYAVPPDGRVQLWAEKPLLAPYVRPDPAALLWSMSGPALSQAELERTWALSGARVAFTAEQGGHLAASASLQRAALSDGSQVRPVFDADLAAGGLAPTGDPALAQVGTYFSPQPPRSGPQPGVLIVDGDEAGASAAFAARTLAAAGFAVIVVPAFGPEGQIPGSSALAVERLDAALRWFTARPAVDPERVFTYGTGAAAPIALWFATHEPDAVYGAIAASGPTALLCAASDGSPTLTAEGAAVPCEPLGRSVADTTILPLEQIRGPVLLACGTADQLLPAACDWTRAGALRRGLRAGQAFLAQGASHEITAPPLLPIGLSDLAPSAAQATEDARAGFWSRVDTLLENAIRR
ncbi:acyl-CoA thioesterase/bile acid-CoA:amino acid N-acyltransferase family protein [Leifsonia sp. AG29]|uniref:acyl-CoA thioesterase/bile acid-CoA:amino acid N-acyltransferase family protein n=1 Tax=Leifsonia sp. AG29 TaxID=2598860 RepID=UPI00131BFB7A|nr:acyl-CoA thioesterase/BAAT N-terminal domain-containing protein [Leifsonia sp. AG29]